MLITLLKVHPMKIVMMGTGPFAVPTFEALLGSSHDVVALFTRPPRPVRGKRKAPINPMKEVADQQGVPVFMPESINDSEAIATLQEFNPDLLVVCDYGQILSPAALEVSPLGGINLHGSLLPKYRGAAPINWAIYHGEQEIGSTVIHMTPKLDGGPCLAFSKTPFGPEDTAVGIEPRMAEQGVHAVIDSIETLQAWDGTSSLGELQDPALVTKAPRLKKTDGEVDWERTAQQIKDQVRAFQPWPGTFSSWQRPQGDPIRLILEQVATVEIASTASPGEVIESDGKQLIIATSEGGLSLQQVKPAGKRVMAIDEFLRGNPVQVGERFGR